MVVALLASAAEIVGALQLLVLVLPVSVAVVVLFDARRSGLRFAPLWAVGLGAATFACFVVADAAFPLLLRVLAAPQPVVVRTPWEVAAGVLLLGTVATGVLLAGYALGPRRRAPS